MSPDLLQMLHRSCSVMIRPLMLSSRTQHNSTFPCPATKILRNFIPAREQLCIMADENCLLIKQCAQRISSNSGISLDQHPPDTPGMFPAVAQTNKRHKYKLHAQPPIVIFCVLLRIIIKITIKSQNVDKLKGRKLRLRPFNIQTLLNNQCANHTLCSV